MEGRSSYEWRNPRGSVDRGLEKLEESPFNLLYGRGLLTDSAKRKIYEQGTVGRAEILERPGDRTTVGGQAQGVFRFIVHLPGREPYEIKSRQSYSGFEWDLLAEGTTVECRVSPANEKRVLLCAPEPDAITPPPAKFERIESSADLLSRGRRAVAMVRESSPLGQKVPGTEDEFFLLLLEVRADGEAPWSVRFGQRVPKGAEPLVAPGCELQVAFSAVGEDDAVAVDWPATSGGRYT
jgi:hypothetical protein